MPQDIVKTTGPLKTANPGVGGGAGKNLPVFGIVKDNIDPTRSGRIKVLIGENSPQDSDNSGNWVTVSYLSNFFGKVAGGGGKDDHGTYKSNPSSYGEWHAPPDIGTKVICIFVNGDPNYGFYIGCVPEPESLQMVPAIGSSDNIIANSGEAKSYGGATRLPVTNFNTNNSSLNNSSTFNDSPRPVHSYTASIMNQQGIIRDPIRGPISSSASREAASRVGWGVSTPGRPIYEGGYDDASVSKNLDKANAKQLKVVARRGGHSFVMDDGDVIGRDQLIRIRTALGHQILMSDDGQTLMILHSNGQSYIELGKEGTVDIFSTNSVNVRTQGDLNLHADRNINIHAMENLNIQAKNIQTNSEEKTKMRAGSDFNIAATAKLTGLAGGAIAWGAGGDASLVGGGQAFVNGGKVNLNSGSPGTSPEAVSPIPLVAQTDTLYDEQKGFVAAPGKLLTIASRAPAHAPWANAGQGVDIKTSMNASDNLPAAPAAAAQATNQAAQATNPKPPATATVASAPANTPPVSSSMNKNVTSAAVAQTATQAASGPLAAAQQQGAAVVNTAEGKVAAVGAMAQTPAQLELGGVLKPGAATIVNALVQEGKTIVQALDKSLFSGAVAGANNLTSLVQNVSAQATSLVNTMQKAQTALGAVGAITGKEAPTQIAGLVSAAATVGVGPVLNAVKQVSSELNNLSSLAGQANNAVTGVTNAVGGITNALSGVTGAIGGAAGAASNAANAVSGVLTGAAGAVGNLAASANSLTGKLAGPVAGAVGAATGALTAGANAIAGANNALGQAQNALKAIGSGGAAAMLTEAVGGLGGIQSALTAMGSVPSLSSLVDQAKGVATSAFNAIKDSFKPLAAGIPQNLTQIAKDNAAAAAATASQTGSQGLTGALNAVGGALSSVAGAATGAANSLGGALSSVAGSVNGALSGVSGAVNGINNSISSISGSLTSAGAAISNIAGAATAVTSTINNVTGVVNTIATATTSALNTTVGGIQNATNAVSAIAGAGPTIVSGGVQALSNAASVVQQGAQAAVSSAMASGLSNLPGGIQTVSSVVNKATGANNAIPGIQGLSSAITNATTSVMNGVSAISSATNALSSVASSVSSVTNSINNVTGSIGNAVAGATGALNSISGAVSGAAGQLAGAAGAINGAAGQLAGAAGSIGGALNSATGAINSALGSVQGTLNGLTSLASAGLPVGAIAQLQSSIASLAGGTPGSISLPSIGFNTSDRGSITNQISAVLGDPGIPKPNLVGEIPQESKDDIENTVKKTKERVTKAREKMDALVAVATSKKTNYLKQRDLQGENDSSTQMFYKEWKELVNSPEWAAAEKELLEAFNADDLARSASLNSKLTAINNANTPEALLALNRKSGGSTLA